MDYDDRNGSDSERRSHIRNGWSFRSINTVIRCIYRNYFHIFSYLVKRTATSSVVRQTEHLQCFIPYQSSIVFFFATRHIFRSTASRLISTPPGPADGESVLARALEVSSSLAPCGQHSALVKSGQPSQFHGVPRSASRSRPGQVKPALRAIQSLFRNKNVNLVQFPYTSNEHSFEPMPHYVHCRTHVSEGLAESRQVEAGHSHVLRLRLGIGDRLAFYQ